MNRRNFLKNTSKTSLSITAISLGIFNEKKQYHESFFSDFDLNEITTDALQKKMQTGEFTAVSVTKMYLKRINEVDKNGPKLHSVIEINSEAIAIATALDKEKKEE